MYKTLYIIENYLYKNEQTSIEYRGVSGVTYPEFCAHFYVGPKDKKQSALRDIKSKWKIAYFFMSISAGGTPDLFPDPEHNSEKYYHWSSTRPPKKEYWVAAQNWDADDFSLSLAEAIKDEAVPYIAESFGIKLQPGERIDKTALVEAITQQFGKMIEGGGNAADEVSIYYDEKNKAPEFRNYVSHAHDKYSKMKTLFYGDERPIDDFFVCNDISFTPKYVVGSGQKIVHATLEKLKNKSPHILLIGKAGSGKSTMMQHLFVNALENYETETKSEYHKYMEDGADEALFETTALFPIFVTLREFGIGHDNLLDLILNSVRRFESAFYMSHLLSRLEIGDCQLLLDGMDEIKDDAVNKFLVQLDELIDKYPDNQVVMTSRATEEFTALSHFKRAYMLPFSEKQIHELLGKLLPEEQVQEIQSCLRSVDRRKCTELITNPLLLTLILMSYDNFADIPTKKWLIYGEAYDVLLRRQDTNKLAFKRVFQSVNTANQFTAIFREFCARSYLEGDFKFDLQKVESYLIKIGVNNTVFEHMSAEAFMYDACESVGIMQKRDDYYFFLHRSFQEYFFADYYLHQGKEKMEKLGRYFEQISFHSWEAMDALYNLASEKVEEVIFFPCLKELFDGYGPQEQYWRFLAFLYKSWEYALLSEDVVRNMFREIIFLQQYPSDAKFNIPKSTTLSWIMQILELEKFIQIKPIGPRFMYSDLTVRPIFEHEIHTTFGFKMESLPLPPPSKEQMRKELMNQILLSTGQDDGRSVYDEDEDYEDYDNYDEEEEMESYNKEKDADKIAYFVDEDIIGYWYKFPFLEGAEHRNKYPAIVELWERDDCPAKAVFKEIQKYYKYLETKYAHISEIDNLF